MREYFFMHTEQVHNLSKQKNLVIFERYLCSRLAWAKNLSANWAWAKKILRTLSMRLKYKMANLSLNS
jgi:hypothetical protein